MPASDYRQLVFRALRITKPGPWSVGDLLLAGDQLTKEFCEQHRPPCDHRAILDWLKSLSIEERTELVKERNEQWEREEH